MRTTAVALSLVLVAVGLSGCLTPETTDGPSGELEQLTFTTIGQGQHSGITDERTVVVREQAAWQQLWGEHARDGELEQEGPPTVDFSERMVVGVFQGTGGNGCHGAEIEQLWRGPNGTLGVKGTWFVPAADAVCTEQLTSPFHIVETQRVAGEAVFQMTEETVGGQDRDGNATDGNTTDGDGPVASNVTFETVAQGGDSGIRDRGERVVRENATWQALWANHTRHHSNPPAAPEVNFSREMVLAVFKGQSADGCHRAEIRNVSQAGDGSYVVDGAYFKIDAAACTLAITYPFHMVTVPADEDPVVFRMSNGTDQDDNGSSHGSRAKVLQETLDQGQQSGVQERREVVVRDSDAWSQLWDEHTSDQTYPDERPQVNFSDEMVIAVFKGESPDTCHGAEIETVWVNEDGTWEVQGAYYVVQGEEMSCAQMITYPFHIVKVDRHDGEVAFDMREETRQAGG